MLSQTANYDHHRGFMDHFRALRKVIFLLFTLFCIATSGPCPASKEQKLVIDDECGPHNENKVHFDNDLVADFDHHILLGDSVAQLSLENVCFNSNLFCFPSTLAGFLSEEKAVEPADLLDSAIQIDHTLSVASSHVKGNSTWTSNFDRFKLSNGRVVSCSLNFLVGAYDSSCCQSNSCGQDDITSCGETLLDKKRQEIENSADIKSEISDGGPLQLEITPALIDWGEKYIYSPSLAFLTVMNTHSSNILNVYEPYSTSTQFYPCNFSELTLAPGEAASVCFVFLPTNLGMSSAQLILQTSFGGFLIQARGFANESPYGIKPILDLDNSNGRRSRKTVSIFNPFEETLYVEEVTAWIYSSSGITSHISKAICSIRSLQDYAEIIDRSVQKWVGKKLDQVDIPDIVMRPHRKWEVAPHSTEVIMELDYQHSQGTKIIGALCMQVLRSSVGKVDLIMVPFEAEVGIISACNDHRNPVLVHLQALMPCDASGTVVAALSLKYDVPCLLKVVKIHAVGDNTQSFQIKYVEGLIMFPGTLTQVAAITYSPFSKYSHSPDSEIPDRSMNCKIVVMTNDSSSPQIEVPCKDIISICSHSSDSHVVHHHPEHVDRDGDIQPRSQRKASGMAQADELVLLNWRSHGTSRDMSVLDDRDVLFPTVKIGTHHPQWVTVKNPSHLPVVMQLILNSGEIIDECRDPNGLLQPSSLSSLIHNKDATPRRYGFSLADDAVTEAYVHPYSRATFGPILFHPGSRCWWKSSALVRNNLSGVEWLSLKGFGGSLSLVLFEGYDPVHRIEFNFNIPQTLNLSSPDMLNANNSSVCSQPYYKEFQAKNTGDLLVEVSKIEISGARCELDGFFVHNCKGFALQPNESMKLVISHQTDYSAPILQRDLQLALSTGILVIPMKASLPMSMLNICTRSLLWMRVKKSWRLIIFALSLMFLLIFCILPQIFLFRGRNCTIANLSHQKNDSSFNCNHRDSSHFAMPAKISGFLRLFGRVVLVSESGSRCSGGRPVTPEQGDSAESLNLASNHPTQKSCFVNPEKEPTLGLPLSKSVAHVNFDRQEASQSDKLTVKVGKEKAKRRRKKKSSTAGLLGQPEVSSSQSGNSTPSSPLSPVTSFTSRSCSKSLDVDPFLEVRSPFANGRREKIPSTEMSLKVNMLDSTRSVNYRNNSTGNTKVKSPTPRRMATPVLLPSATFPSAGKSMASMFSASPLLASTSSIAPHARAPGSKLINQKLVRTTDEKINEDSFKYDIWGDHLFGLQLMERSREVYTMSRFATKSDSDTDSFFVRGPQNIMPNSQVTFVGSHKEG